MIEVYKYTHGLYKVSALPVEVEKTTRGHNYKLTKKRCSTTRRLKFFSMRVVNAWNSLPVHVVNAESVNSFKSRLDMCWAHIMFSTELPAHEQIAWANLMTDESKVKTTFIRPVNRTMSYEDRRGYNIINNNPLNKLFRFRLTEE